jgi:carbamate kinase
MSGEGPILVALGGNALILPGEKGYIQEQFSHTTSCMRPIAALISRGESVVLTHGNGPIVGNILLRNECAKEYIPPMPLSICVADSQGGIGAMMAQSLRNELRNNRTEGNVLAVITHVVVDGKDPAFGDPSKPIGPYYSGETAKEHQEKEGWVMREIPGRGWRRLVPSPRPVKIVELESVRDLLTKGAIPIAAGGGGIPVIEEEGKLKGVDAVIDKDLCASLLCRKLGLKRFVILTDVDGVYLDWQGEKKKRLEHLSLREARTYLDEGQFPRGDMGPKIEAAIECIESDVERVIIARPEDLAQALKGRAGTTITA